MSFLAGYFGISIRTVYDIKKRKEKNIKYYLSSKSNARISNRKTIHPANSENLDDVLYDWFKQRKGESVPITGSL